ncbi:MAG: glucuronyl hydrolase [Chloroflexi bacterium]|nr:glucuronyl hydrolase [Chloroflexota bacterium]
MNPIAMAVKLYDHYESMEEVKHYFGLLAIYGLAQAAEASGDAATWERCRAILRRFPDQVEHPRYNTASYAIGGIPKAYLLWRGRMPEAEPQVRAYAEEAMRAPRDPQGIIKNPYRPDENLIWIDLAMAVTPYLLFAGLALDEPRYIDEAVRQTLSMVEVFLDPANGLLHQCRNFTGPGLISTDHWGRGNGWGHIALAELALHLPADSPHRPAAERAFRDHALALLPYQSPGGLWRQELAMPDAWEESSGTALILYGYGIGLRTGLLASSAFRPAFERGIAALNQRCINADFSTELSCPGCLCPGEGSEKGTPEAYVRLRQPTHDEHHSYGPFMLALVEAYRNGITDVPR